MYSVGHANDVSRATEDLDYSSITHKLENHESRQQELQRYIKMVASVTLYIMYAHVISFYFILMFVASGSITNKLHHDE